MTSNVGSTIILERGSHDWAEVEAQVLAALRQTFRPEFLNRVDDVIVFRPLGEPEIERIIDLQLARLGRLLADKKLTLELTPGARRLIASEGYDPTYGARPLKRALQRLVQNSLALGVLEGKFREGDHIVATQGSKGTLTFDAIRPSSEAAEEATVGAGGRGEGSGGRSAK